MTKITVGIRFQPLGDGTVTDESSIGKKHWVAVFQSSTDLRSVELIPVGGIIKIHDSNHRQGSLKFHLLATFEGEWSDIDRAVRQHPMRNTEYTACFNNCQHFVAKLLLLLQALAKDDSGRRFDIAYGCRDRWDNVIAVLSEDGAKIWNSPNVYLQMANRLPVPAVATATAAAAIAADATVAVVVPATGIMGWFGATTTVVAPAAYAGAAAAAVPVGMGVTAALGLEYWRRSRKWKEATLMDDPRVRGFPKAYRAPIGIDEYYDSVAAKRAGKGSCWESSRTASEVASGVAIGTALGGSAGALLPGPSLLASASVAAASGSRLASQNKQWA